MSLPFLPEKLYLSGSYEEIISSLYSIFEVDIKQSGLQYKGMKVIFDNRKIDSDYEEGFWHIVTRGKDDRLMDFKRAKRLVWLRPLIENSDDSALYKWVERLRNRKGKMVNRTFIWYRKGKYLIVLEERPNRYFLATAFYIMGDRNDRYYFQRCQKAKKKGAGY